MGIYEGAEEVLVITNYHCPCLTGGIDRIYRVKCRRAVYLRAILRRTDVHTRDICILP